MRRSRLWRPLGVAYAELVLWRRQWMWIAQDAVWTLSLPLIFYFWGGLKALKSLVVASFVATGWTVGVNLVGQVVGWQRVSRIQEALVASPLSPSDYFVGTVLGQIPYFLTEYTAFTLLALWLEVSPAGVAALYALSFASLVLGSFLSLAVVLRIKNPMNISAITSPLVTVTTVLPPVWYPLSALPEVARLPALLAPTAALAELARWVAGLGCMDPAVPLLVTFVWIAGTGVALKSALHWGLEK